MYGIPFDSEDQIQSEIIEFIIQKDESSLCFLQIDPSHYRKHFARDLSKDSFEYASTEFSLEKFENLIRKQPKFHDFPKISEFLTKPDFAKEPEILESIGSTLEKYVFPKFFSINLYSILKFQIMKYINIRLIDPPSTYYKNLLAESLDHHTLNFVYNEILENIDKYGLKGETNQVADMFYGHIFQFPKDYIMSNIIMEGIQNNKNEKIGIFVINQHFDPICKILEERKKDQNFLRIAHFHSGEKKNGEEREKNLRILEEINKI